MNISILSSFIIIVLKCLSYAFNIPVIVVLFLRNTETFLADERKESGECGIRGVKRHR